MSRIGRRGVRRPGRVQLRSQLAEASATCAPPGVSARGCLALIRASRPGRPRGRTRRSRRRARSWRTGAQPPADPGRRGPVPRGRVDQVVDELLDRRAGPRCVREVVRLPQGPGCPVRVGDARGPVTSLVLGSRLLRHRHRGGWPVFQLLWVVCAAVALAGRCRPCCARGARVDLAVSPRARIAGDDAAGPVVAARSAGGLPRSSSRPGSFPHPGPATPAPAAHAAPQPAPSRNGSRSPACTAG